MLMTCMCRWRIEGTAWKPTRNLVAGSFDLTLEKIERSFFWQAWGGDVLCNHDVSLFFH